MRHGQTLFNVRRRIQGWCDSPLTELGKQQALKAKEYIKDISFDAVYASYLIRYEIDATKAAPEFIGHILQSSAWYDYVDAIAGGSAQPGANAKQLGSFELQIGSFELPKIV